MEIKDPIFVVVTRAKPQITSKRKISEGSKIICKAQMKAKADIFYVGFGKQAEKLKVGVRVVILRGGYKTYREKYGSVRFIAAGVVKEAARKMTREDVFKYLDLWITAKQWYRGWTKFNDLSSQLIIKYELTKAKKHMSKPKEIITNPRTKVIELKPTNRIYAIMDKWWNKVVIPNLFDQVD